MDTIVIRLDLDPESAEAAKIALGLVLDAVYRDLADSPPVHTKAALETQRERLESVVRAVDVGLANPVVVDVVLPPTPESAS